MPGENSDVVRRFVEGYQSKHDASVAEELLAEDFVDRSPFAGLPPSREGVLTLFGMLFTAFPDLHATIHDQIEEYDKVVTRKSFHGTHEGEFMGLPATGRSVSWDVIDIVRVRGGKMVEHWNVVDALGLMQQLGVAPA